jgi:hypothetical protein
MRKMLLGAAFLALLLSLHSQTPKAAHSRQRYWTETDAETLWRIRYINCDYGYFVSIEPGTVGHGTHGPSPNHGFLVSLPDVGRVSLASDEEERFVWVNASYDVIDDQSLVGAARENIKSSDERRGGPGQAKRRHATLAGLPAIWIRMEHKTPKGLVVEESVVAVRLGIVYTVGLTTLQQDLSHDEKQFKEILDGFHLLKLRDAKTVSFYCLN